MDELLNWETARCFFISGDTSSVFSFNCLVSRVSGCLFFTEVASALGVSFEFLYIFVMYKTASGDNIVKLLLYQL